MPVGVGLGILAAGTELAAIIMFITIIMKTAQQSVEPRNPYEKFIFGALFWFFVQAVFSDVFFFAKVTAAGEQQLVTRIALLDGPLRDIQLFGFAALIIAGVSQRFVPTVYGLGKPQRDWQTVIFYLINSALLLDVASYVLFFSTGKTYFAAGLELSYFLMVVWAVLLIRQLRVFAPTSQPDRSLKFIRAAYAWLVFAMAMLPFLIVYGVLMHQGFSHAFMGSHRHAYTVGFISMMILGVASRVVPILAGVDSGRVSRLWGPIHSAECGLRRTRVAASAHRLHPCQSVPAGGPDRIHRSHRTWLVGRGIVAYHESRANAPSETAGCLAAGRSAVASSWPRFGNDPHLIWLRYGFLPQFRGVWW